MQFPLSHLLYYDLATIKHGKIKKSFNEYKLLLSALIEAIEAFEEGHLEKFDSLVGENACQIRAIRIAIIHSKNSLNPTLKFLAQEAKKEIDQLVETKIRSLESSKLSMQEVFDKYGLELLLSEDEVFILTAYILSEMKEVYPEELILKNLEKKDKTSPQKIKRINSDISYSFGSKLNSHLRKLLSKLSVEFVQKEAAELDDDTLEQMVSDKHTVTHNALQCIPMYWTYKTLLKSAQKKDIPIIIVVNFTKKSDKGYIITSRKKFIFEPKDTCFQRVHVYKDEVKKAACIVEGFTASSEEAWNQTSLSFSLIEMILAGAADHRQYPNSLLCPIVENEEHNYFQKMAKQEGFSQENPSTFYIQHVFPSMTQSL